MTVATAYPLTDAAFIDLISVETRTRSLAEELDRCERDLADPSHFPEGFWYLAPFDADMPEDLRLMRAARRDSCPPKFRPYWRALDSYHSTRARWRAALGKARASINAAIEELDYANTPPLDRPSAKVLRVIQALHMAVPDPVWFGDYPPTGRGYADKLRSTIPEVSKWVDELRIMRDSTVRPTRTAPNEENAKSLAKEARKRDRLRNRLVGPGSDGLLILQHMKKGLITDRQDALKAPAIVYAALGREWKRSDKDLFTKLVEGRFLHSATGAHGGYWITSDGLALVHQSA